MVEIEEDVIREAVQGIWSAHDRVYVNHGEDFTAAHLRLSSAAKDFRETARALGSYLHDALKKAPAPQGDLEFFKGLWRNQKESILSLYAKLDEAEAARDEATARAAHAEEELAVASWLAQENLRCCELRDGEIELLSDDLRDARGALGDAKDRIAVLEMDVRMLNNVVSAAENGCAYHEKRANDIHDALTLAEAERRDMEERATNAEYNAKHYWRELQAETNKARMYRQERDFERRRYDEAMRPTLTFNTGIGLTATRSGSASDGIGKG